MPHLRARWVALRSLHRRMDAVVGRSAAGPIYSVDAVRLILPPGARHFRRLAGCATCGQDVVDHARPLRRQSDLSCDVRLLCWRCSEAPAQDPPENDSLRHVKVIPRDE